MINETANSPIIPNMRVLIPLDSVSIVLTEIVKFKFVVVSVVTLKISVIKQQCIRCIKIKPFFVMLPPHVTFRLK